MCYLCTLVLERTSDVTHEEFTCMENSDILPKAIRLIPELSSLYLEEKNIVISEDPEKTQNKQTSVLNFYPLAQSPLQCYISSSHLA